MNRPPDGGGPASPGGARGFRRRWIHRLVAAALVLAPLLWLVVADAASLLSVLLDPASACWMKTPDGHWVFGSELALLTLVSTLEYWAPIALLAFFMFWFFEWLRPGDAVAIVVAYGAGLYVLAYETAWMAEIYRQQYQAGCA